MANIQLAGGKGIGCKVGFGEVRYAVQLLKIC
jgi:hypothetical protein